MFILRIALGLLLLAARPAAAQVFGSALELNGSDQYAYTDRLMDFGDGGSLTIEVWVRVSPGTGGTIVGNHYNGVAWESVELTTSAFTITSFNAQSSRQNVFYGPIDDDMWHHVAAVWDGTSIVVYLDGVLDAGPVSASSAPWDSGTWMHIGARPSTLTPPVSSDFTGQLDELRLWSVARSPAQILATMDVPLGPEYTATADSGLAGYYPFDAIEDLGFREAGVNDLADLSVSYRTAELVAGRLVPEATAAPWAAMGTLALFPNPFRGTTSIALAGSLPAPGQVEVEIFDLAGRRVRVLRASDAAPGDLVWDGRDGVGAPVGAGVYAVRWSADGSVRGRAKVVLRR